MVIKDQYILTLYENNFPLTTKSKESILYRIDAANLQKTGVLIYPGGLPTTGIDPIEVAGTVHNLKLIIISKDQWQLRGDLEIFDTPNGRHLSQLQLADLQFWVRGYIEHGYNGGLRDFLHLSYTPRAAISKTQLSFQLR